MKNSFTLECIYCHGGRSQVMTDAMQEVSQDDAQVDQTSFLNVDP